jgi:integrase
VTPRPATRDLNHWLKRAGLPYRSPHKFRHGHAVCALKMAKDASALKAVSQNLMHPDLSVTDGVYGMFSEKDLGRLIAALGVDVAEDRQPSYDRLTLLLKDVLDQLEQRRSL